MAGGVVSYYFVLGVSACRKGDPKTFVLGTRVNWEKILVYLKLGSEATAKKNIRKNACVVHFLNV